MSGSTASESRLVDYCLVLGPRVVGKRFLRAKQEQIRKDSRTIVPITDLTLVFTREQDHIPEGYEPVLDVEQRRVDLNSHGKGQVLLYEARNPEVLQVPMDASTSYPGAPEPGEGEEPQSHTDPTSDETEGKDESTIREEIPTHSETEPGPPNAKSPTSASTSTHGVESDHEQPKEKQVLPITDICVLVGKKATCPAGFEPISTRRYGRRDVTLCVSRDPSKPPVIDVCIVQAAVPESYLSAAYAEKLGKEHSKPERIASLIHPAVIAACPPDFTPCPVSISGNIQHESVLASASATPALPPTDNADFALPAPTSTPPAPLSASVATGGTLTGTPTSTLPMGGAAVTVSSSQTSLSAGSTTAPVTVSHPNLGVLSPPGVKSSSEVTQLVTSYFICIKKMKVSEDTFSAPDLMICLLDRYPHYNHTSYKLDVNAIKFLSFPMGAVLRVTPQLPHFMTFARTLENGRELYGTALAFADPVNVESELSEDPQFSAKALELASRSKNSITKKRYTKTLYVRKCICLISQLPFTTSFQVFLEQVYRLAVTNPISKYVRAICEYVPVPRPGLEYSLLPVGHERVIFQRPPAFGPPPPALASAFEDLFRLLSIENIVAIWRQLLVGGKIVVFSNSHQMLTPITDVLRSLIYPLPFQCTYIPILPNSLSFVLGSPVPFLIGVHRSFLERTRPHAEIMLVDLDRNLLRMPVEEPDDSNDEDLRSFGDSRLQDDLRSSPEPGDPLGRSSSPTSTTSWSVIPTNTETELPREIEERLIAELHACGANLYRSQDLSSVDQTIYSNLWESGEDDVPPIRGSDSTTGPRAPFDDRAIRACFLRAACALFSSARFHLPVRPVPASISVLPPDALRPFLTHEESLDLGTKLGAPGLAALFPPNWRGFAKRCVGSQNFAQFVERRSFHSEHSHEVLFFDWCVEAFSDMEQQHQQPQPQQNMATQESALSHLVQQLTIHARAAPILFPTDVPASRELDCTPSQLPSGAEGTQSRAASGSPFETMRLVPDPEFDKYRAQKILERLDETLESKKDGIEDESEATQGEPENTDRILAEAENMEPYDEDLLFPTSPHPGWRPPARARHRFPIEYRPPKLYSITIAGNAQGDKKGQILRGGLDPTGPLTHLQESADILTSQSVTSLFLLTTYFREALHVAYLSAQGNWVFPSYRTWAMELLQQRQRFQHATPVLPKISNVQDSLAVPPSTALALITTSKSIEQALAPHPPLFLNDADTRPADPLEEAKAAGPTAALAAESVIAAHRVVQEYADTIPVSLSPSAATYRFVRNINETSQSNVSAQIEIAAEAPFMDAALVQSLTSVLPTIPPVVSIHPSENNVDLVLSRPRMHSISRSNTFGSNPPLFPLTPLSNELHVAQRLVANVYEIWFALFPMRTASPALLAPGVLALQQQDLVVDSETGMPVPDPDNIDTKTQKTCVLKREQAAIARVHGWIKRVRGIRTKLAEIDDKLARTLSAIAKKSLDAGDVSRTEKGKSPIDEEDLNVEDSLEDLDNVIRDLALMLAEAGEPPHLKPSVEGSRPHGDLMALSSIRFTGAIGGFSLFTKRSCPKMEKLATSALDTESLALIRAAASRDLLVIVTQLALMLQRKVLPTKMTLIEVCSYCALTGLESSFQSLYRILVAATPHPGARSIFAIANSCSGHTHPSDVSERPEMLWESTLREIDEVLKVRPRMLGVGGLEPEEPAVGAATTTAAEATEAPHLKPKGDGTAQGDCPLCTYETNYLGALECPVPKPNFHSHADVTLANMNTIQPLELFLRLRRVYTEAKCPSCGYKMSGSDVMTAFALLSEDTVGSNLANEGVVACVACLARTKPELVFEFGATEPGSNKTSIVRLPFLNPRLLRASVHTVRGQMLKKFEADRVANVQYYETLKLHKSTTRAGLSDANGNADELKKFTLRSPTRPRTCPRHGEVLNTSVGDALTRSAKEVLQVRKRCVEAQNELRDRGSVIRPLDKPIEAVDTTLDIPTIPPPPPPPAPLAGSTIRAIRQRPALLWNLFWYFATRGGSFHTAPPPPVISGDDRCTSPTIDLSSSAASLLNDLGNLAALPYLFLFTDEDPIVSLCPGLALPSEHAMKEPLLLQTLHGPLVASALMRKAVFLQPISAPWELTFEDVIKPPNSTTHEQSCALSTLPEAVGKDASVPSGVSREKGSALAKSLQCAETVLVKQLAAAQSESDEPNKIEARDLLDPRIASLTSHFHRKGSMDQPTSGGVATAVASPPVGSAPLETYVTSTFSPTTAMAMLQSEQGQVARSPGAATDFSDDLLSIPEQRAAAALLSALPPVFSAQLAAQRRMRVSVAPKILSEAVKYIPNGLFAQHILLLLIRTIKLDNALRSVVKEFLLLRALIEALSPLVKFHPEDLAFFDAPMGQQLLRCYFIAANYHNLHAMPASEIAGTEVPENSPLRAEVASLRVSNMLESEFMERYQTALLWTLHTTATPVTDVVVSSGTPVKTEIDIDPMVADALGRYGDSVRFVLLHPYIREFYKYGVMIRQQFRRFDMYPCRSPLWLFTQSRLCSPDLPAPTIEPGFRTITPRRFAEQLVSVELIWGTARHRNVFSSRLSAMPREHAGFVAEPENNSAAAISLRAVSIFCSDLLDHETVKQDASRSVLSAPFQITVDASNATESGSKSSTVQPGQNRTGMSRSGNHSKAARSFVYAATMRKRGSMTDQDLLAMPPGGWTPGGAGTIPTARQFATPSQDSNVQTNGGHTPAEPQSPYSPQETMGRDAAMDRNSSSTERPIPTTLPYEAAHLDTTTHTSSNPRESATLSIATVPSTPAGSTDYDSLQTPDPDSARPDPTTMTQLASAASTSAIRPPRIDTSVTLSPSKQLHSRSVSMITLPVTSFQCKLQSPFLDKLSQIWRHAIDFEHVRVSAELSSVISASTSVEWRPLTKLLVGGRLGSDVLTAPSRSALEYLLAKRLELIRAKECKSIRPASDIGKTESVAFLPVFDLPAHEMVNIHPQIGNGALNREKLYEAQLLEHNQVLPEPLTAPGLAQGSDRTESLNQLEPHSAPYATHSLYGDAETKSTGVELSPGVSTSLMLAPIEQEEKPIHAQNNNEPMSTDGDMANFKHSPSLAAASGFSHTLQVPNEASAAQLKKQRSVSDVDEIEAEVYNAPLEECDNDSETQDEAEFEGDDSRAEAAEDEAVSPPVTFKGSTVANSPRRISVPAQRPPTIDRRESDVQ